MDNIGIVESKYKSCAFLTIQCLAEIGIAERQKLFKHHIGNAKTLGLMPDDFKVIRATLSDYGFVMQSSRLENLRLTEVISMLDSKLAASASVLVSLRSYAHMGGYMLALQTDGAHGFRTFHHDSEPKDLEAREVTHVWIRWADGIDRSPYPRKTIGRRTSRRKTRERKDTECYKNFNPNPCGNLIGDCVIRAFAGVMEISWNDAVDRLSAGGETTVNTPNVYSGVLEREGFVYHKPLIRGGRKLTGKAFCLEMDRLYHKGERIFAYVGRNHVAAIVPTGGNYRIMDSWDSSSRLIGEFWVKTSERPVPAAKTENMFCETFAVGDSLQHPSFGVGIVTAVNQRVVTIDFGANGHRRLGADWVVNHCTHTVA